MISLYVQTKEKKHSARFHKHKTEQKNVYIRLETLSSTHISVKSIQMDIFHQIIL